MPLNLDQINEQMNASNPGKIAVVNSVGVAKVEQKFIYSIDEFDPENWTLLSPNEDLIIHTEVQKLLAKKEIDFLNSILLGGPEDIGTYELIDDLQNAIIDYLEEQLEFYKDTPFAEIGD